MWAAIFLAVIFSSLIRTGRTRTEAEAESLIENDTTNFLYREGEEDLVISPAETLLWGPGLRPHEIRLPARYFFIRFVSKNKELPKRLKGMVEKEDVKVRIDCAGDRQVWTQILDRRDASFIVRYKVFHSCRSGFRILVTYKNHHLGKSPYVFNAPVHSDGCYCPEMEARKWLKRVGCPGSYAQLSTDLQPFPKRSVNFETVLQRTVEKFYHPGSHSFCHYAILDNEIYRKCYGQHVGFHIFPDAILLFLSRLMFLPNLEFIMNLGDWPLIQKQRVRPPLPVFSWCKSNETLDIILPTYELTEASLEAMGRVTLDMMSVQGNSPVDWESKIPKLFWRGRDSRQERLNLIELSRNHSQLFNVSLTNFFFFRDQESRYGPKSPHVSFFQFFMYKYQLNIDGTVAAYRFPFLLGGDSLVFKVDSPYQEFFYRDLKEFLHYVPVGANLQDLVSRIEWAQDHDKDAEKIAANGRKYAEEHLMPLDVICYHATAYQEWSYRLRNPVVISPDMEHVKRSQSSRSNPMTCDCEPAPRPSPGRTGKLEL